MLRAVAGALLVLVLALPAFGQDAQGPGRARRQAAPPAADSGADPKGPSVSQQVKEGFQLYRRFRDSIVSIKVTTRSYPLPPMNLPGVTQSGAGLVAEELDGTGFIVTTAGHVATVYRLVNNASKIDVRFADGSNATARVKGVLPTLDLAVLELSRTPVVAEPIVQYGDVGKDETQRAWFFSASADPRLPDSEPLRVKLAADLGSAYDRFLAGPGPLKPGSAGGPILDPKGRLLGMAAGSTFQVNPKTGAPTSTTLFVQGSDIQRIVKNVKTTGSVQRPMLGILLANRSNRIDLLLDDGPAMKAGLKVGDMIVAIDGERCETALCVTRNLLRRSVGDKLVVRIVRGKKEFERSLVLALASTPKATKIPPLTGVEAGSRCRPRW